MTSRKRLCASPWTEFEALYELGDLASLVA